MGTFAPGKLHVAVWLLLGLLLLAAVGWRLYWYDEEPAEEPFSSQRYIMPQAPVTDIAVKRLAEVKDRLNPAELVLGVTVGAQSRAYPIRTFQTVVARKVLNDTLDGHPIAATWCDACHNAIVFSRELDGRTLTLAVFGALWKQSMLMRDEETGSVWSQMQGKAKLGPLQGARLEMLPSVVTDWQSWSRLCPDSTVAWFDGPSEALTRDVYDDPKNFVLGIATGRRARAWSFAELSRQGAINDTYEGRPVLVVLDSPSRTARLYQRDVAGRTLTFALDKGGLTDKETESTWEPTTGKALAGPLKGQWLTPLPAVVSFQDAWLRFHPRSR